MKLETLLNKVIKFNSLLENFYKETDDSIPDIECTLLEFSKIHYRVSNNQVTRLEIYDHHKGEPIVDTFNLPEDNDLLLDQLNYDKRRLNKAIRVFKSENPDQELLID